MNVDRILQTMNRHRVEYLLIGGVNFLLRHGATLTYDVDLWIDDTEDNRARCEQALADLSAEWGADDDDWGPVADKPKGWLSRQGVFCLTSPHGSIDVFRSVAGLSSWKQARQQAIAAATQNTTRYYGLSDADMLQSQMALPEERRNRDRIETLRKTLGAQNND
jgi:hypothetical protein